MPTDVFIERSILIALWWQASLHMAYWEQAQRHWNFWLFTLDTDADIYVLMCFLDSLI